MRSRTPDVWRRLHGTPALTEPPRFRPKVQRVRPLAVDSASLGDRARHDEAGRHAEEERDPSRSHRADTMALYTLRLHLAAHTQSGD
jgi:hypothetical protein